jgi:hypothetical protein
VRNALGYRKKSDTCDYQDAECQARYLPREQQDRPIWAVLRLVAQILLGRLRLLPPRHDIREPPLMREQTRAGSLHRHSPIVA